MSWDTQTENERVWRQEVFKYRCRYCAAEPGVDCVNREGYGTMYPHYNRMEAAVLHLLALTKEQQLPDYALKVLSEFVEQHK